VYKQLGTSRVVLSSMELVLCIIKDSSLIYTVLDTGVNVFVNSNSVSRAIRKKRWPPTGSGS
jgi:hypothetical protein